MVWLVNNKKMKTDKKTIGQSIIEVVFAVGVIGLVLTGVISLVVKSVNSNSKTMTRDKAVELANIVMEGLVAKQKNSPATFWNLTDVSIPQVWPDFDNRYKYEFDFTRNSTSGSCSVSRINCAQVDVTVSWQAETSKNVTFSRFFRR